MDTKFNLKAKEKAKEEYKILDLITQRGANINGYLID
jgi:hypothetical protein